jgi:hypothetical protein
MQGQRACEYGGADMPCPDCNRAEGHEIPRLPFTPDDEIKRHCGAVADDLTIQLRLKREAFVGRLPTDELNL